MGFISDYARKDESTSSVRRSPADRGPGRALWQEIFGTGATNKEEQRPHSRPIPGGSHGRSITSSDAAFKRLLQAMRSMAPGGWSDDRWAETKTFTGIQYLAIHRKAEQLAQGEFQVFVKDDNHQDGKRPVKKGEEGWNLVKLLEKPNNQDSFGDMLYRIVQQMDLTGMALTWMVPNQLSIPMELYVIPTAIAIPQPAINPDFPDGYYRIQPVYPYGPFSSYPTPNSAVGAPIPAQWMMRCMYPHPLLRYDGYSPQSALRLHIDEVDMMDRSRHSSMRREINPSAVLNFDEMEGSQPLPEAEIDRIRAEFENLFMGPQNTGNLFVATPGAKLEAWGARPVDMDYQSGWDQLVNFILGAFGITKPAAGMVDDSSYSTLFATLKQLYWITLDPMCNRIGSNLTRHLAPFFGDDLIVEIRCKPIDDHDVKNARMDKLMQGKAITKNELRKEMEMPLTKEEWGEEIAGTETQQEGQPGMPGMPQPGQEEQQPEGMEEAVAQQEDDVEAPEATETRPQPGNLGRGALGPRQKRFHLNGKNGHARKK